VDVKKIRVKVFRVYKRVDLAYDRNESLFTTVGYAT